MTGVTMARVTVITAVIVPGPMGRQNAAVIGMEARVCAQQTVKIVVASRPGAGRIGRVVTGGAIFDIIAGRHPVLGRP